MIYLDHNATTPLDTQVGVVVRGAELAAFGNPSSIHAAGRSARALLDESRERLAVLWGCRPSEIVFTSGGTEANNLAVLGAARARRDRGRHLITSAVEHPSVRQAFEYLAAREGFEVTILSTDPLGVIEPEEVRRALRPDTTLVSVMAANNEVGTLEPVREIGELCREHGVCFHTDAVQWFGKEPVGAIDDFAADLVAACAHKLGGPRGAGVLYARSPLPLQPLLMGGSQENDRRAGTENLPAIVGLVTAWERFTKPPLFDRSRLEPLTALLETRCLAIEGTRRWGPPLPQRLANTLAITVSGCDSLSLLAGLDLAGVCASSGSACSAGSLEPSHVLTSLGASATEASGLVRFSLGPETTRAEVMAAAEALAAVVTRVRKRG
ncbi:MAG: cysteine desulfurase [Verrucomicrobiales bacterium]|nr:cysteine desulfurase [Verrucomicrobiales bacterium]